MKKNVASQKIGAQLVSATDGSAFTGSVTVYVTGDAGTQAVGSVGSGACTHEGNGYHTYAPAQAETNYDLIAFTFTGTGAIPVTIQVYTSFPQTGDSYPEVSSGTYGLSQIKTQTAAIEVDTQDIQSRLPAALVGGRMDANTSAIGGSTTPVTNIGTVFNTDFATNYNTTIDMWNVNVENWNTTAVPAEHTAGYPIVTVKDGTGTGEINTNAGAIALVDLVTTTTTATNVTTVNGLAAGVITAAAIATDAIDADALAADAIAEINATVDTALADIRLDELLAADSDIDGAAPPTVGSVFHELMSKTTGSFTYDQTTDSLEALRDNAGTNGAAYVFASGALANITAWTVAITGNITGNLSGSVGSVTGAVGSVTNPVTVTGDCATAGTRFLTMIELDGSVYRYTTNSLEQAPSGGGGGTDWTADERTALRAILGIPSSGTTPENPTAGILDTIRDDTNELQTDWANGGRLDNILDARASQTSVDDLPTNTELTAAISDFLTTHGLTASRTGTAQAGAAGTITLDASASATNDIYNGMLCRIVSGTGAGQWRVIYDYVGATKVAHVKPNWTTTPDNTSVFAVRSCSAADIQLLNGDNEIGDSDRFPSVT